MVAPATNAELSEAIRSLDSVVTVGAGTRYSFRSANSAANVSLSALTGIVDYCAEDQVVSVRAGSSISEVQETLAKSAQCLPLAYPHEGTWTRESSATIGGEASMALPHALESQCGTWRDWVLGMTLVLADGTVCKSGSHAVKNVAGYDAHKMMIGARGTLAVIAEVILRTYPIKSLPQPQAMFLAGHSGPREWIQRVSRTDFAAAKIAAEKYAGWIDEPSSTLWLRLPEDETMPRFEDDWLITPGTPAFDETQFRLMRRAKDLLDPSGKFNQGEFGL